VSDRSCWRELCKDAIEDHEPRCVDTVKEKRRLRKEGPKMTTDGFTMSRDYVAALMSPESAYSRIDEHRLRTSDEPGELSQ